MARTASAALQADRQLYNRLAEIPCRRATILTWPPSASTSAISAAFCSGVQRRRRSTITSPATPSASFWTLQKEQASLRPLDPATRRRPVQTGRLQGCHNQWFSNKSRDARDE